MQTIGQLVQQAIELSGRNSFEPAFVTICDAISETAQVVFADESAPEQSYQKFINQNWQLIYFMGFVPDENLPLNFSPRLRRIITSFNGWRAMEEMTVFAVRQTLALRRLPEEIGFIQGGRFEIDGDRLLLPQSLLFALIGSIVLSPANKNETIPGNYWLNIRDFKMFISELWGRADLAERVMQQYS